jgi:hypothetical protein
LQILFWILTIQVRIGRFQPGQPHCQGLFGSFLNLSVQSRIDGESLVG